MFIKVFIYGHASTFGIHAKGLLLEQPHTMQKAVKLLIIKDSFKYSCVCVHSRPKILRFCRPRGPKKRGRLGREYCGREKLTSETPIEHACNDFWSVSDVISIS